MTQNETRAIDADFEQGDYGDAIWNDSTGYNAEKQLWCAVIFLAVLDFRNNTKKDIYHRDQAVKWFIEAEKDFKFVCSLAGMNPQKIRDGVLKEVPDL